MGFTFKENCPDIRNTKVIDIILELKQYGIAVDIWDPWANQANLQQQYGLEITLELEPGKYDGIILAVAHNEIKKLGIKKIRSLGKSNHIVYDIKYCLDKAESDLRL
jgi:UDP-N-acetyl-D-galactosamine dehydrogenase